MKIDFNNPGHIKAAILSDCIYLSEEARKEVGLKYAENRYPYGRSNNESWDLRSIPSELLLPEDIVIGVHLKNKKETPWSIEVNKSGQVELHFEDKSVTPISFSPRPNFFDKKLSNEKLAQQEIVLYGKYSLSLFNRGWCYFFGTKEQCKFCSLGTTRDDVGADNIFNIFPPIAEEAAIMAFKEEPRIKHVDYCAGTHPDNNIGIKQQMDLIKVVSKVAPRGITHHLLTFPPDDLNLLAELKAAGLNSIAFNLEVFDENLFKEICPGKQSHYGYGKFFDAFDEAVRVFGKGNVYCGFVGGLEPIKSLRKGFDELLKRDVVPSINWFHPDPESDYKNMARPSKEYIFEAAKAMSYIYLGNNFQPIFPGGTRNSLDTEIWREYFV